MAEKCKWQKKKGKKEKKKEKKEQEEKDGEQKKKEKKEKKKKKAPLLSKANLHTFQVAMRNIQQEAPLHRVHRGRIVLDVLSDEEAIAWRTRIVGRWLHEPAMKGTSLRAYALLCAQRQTIAYPGIYGDDMKELIAAKRMAKEHIAAKNMAKEHIASKHIAVKHIADVGVRHVPGAVWS